MKKVLIITGPTGTGKTKLSIEVAKKYNTEIINGDALQVYKGMNILTAKIKEEEKEGIKHHLFDILEPTEEFSIADYQIMVRKYIDEFTSINKLPIIAGGSGLYLDSVIYDYRFDEEKRNDNIEEEYKELTNEELHNILKELSIEAANKIHMNNRKRVLRAIELAKKDAVITEFNNTLLYDALIIYLTEDREKLYTALNNRVDKMIEEGILAEVKELSKLQISKTAKGAIGYKEFLPYLNGEISLDVAIEEVKKNTRHLAKRQTTWFKKRDNITIISIDRSNFRNTINEAISIIDEWLVK